MNNLTSKVNGFYQQYVKAEDKIIFSLLAVSLTISAAYILANLFGAQFPGNPPWLGWKFYLGIPVMSGLFLLAIYARNLSPRMSFLTWTYTIYYFIVLCLSMAAYGIQFTPFPPIDSMLIKIDQLMHFSQLALLNYTYQHHNLLEIMNQCYGLIGLELSLIPLVLALLMLRRAVCVLYLSLILSFIVGSAIYYFFPTTAPASMFVDAHFAQQQHDTFIKFYEIRHYLPITTTEGGLIAFPSFHVIWCILLAYAFKERKWLFIPMTLLNGTMILSTIFLGWHYLTDVIGGIILATTAIYYAEKIHTRYIHTDYHARK